MPISSLKRPAPDDPAPIAKHTKPNRPTTGSINASTGVTTQNEGKSCHGCGETDTSFPALSSQCKGKHSNDYCKLCYTKYINTKFMADVTGSTPCIQCPAEITHADIKRIIGAKNSRHYDYLVDRARAEKDGKYICLGDITDAAGNKVTCHSIHNHSVEKDGRVFHCSKCSDEQCVPCGVREHKGETCTTFQTRIKAEHAAEDALTAKMIQEGYTALEDGKQKNKSPSPCPCCGVLIEKDGKCPHMTCVTCGNQFCIRCNAPYYGVRSVVELGNKAHKPECVYFKREKEDRRFVRKKKGAKGRVVKAGEDDD